MLKTARQIVPFILILLCSELLVGANPRPGKTVSFNSGWRFHLGDIDNGQAPVVDDSSWRKLDLPHDWSIEGEFSEQNPATPGGGALPGGVGWYRKTFSVPATEKKRQLFVEFDGVYRNSEVWINGHFLGKRPYGYSSFEYELSPYLNYGGEKNVIAVKVDNSKQPNSRWYSGSGIYRNVWLTTTEKVFVGHWGTYVTTPEVKSETARVEVSTTIRNSISTDQPVRLTTVVIDATGSVVARSLSKAVIAKGGGAELQQSLIVKQPKLWSIETPYLYKAVSEIEQNGNVLDRYETPFGIRSFSFDVGRGFFLNGKPVKILGVCDHHDLGSLGAA
ncbi:MAG: beta-galactosidase, partial [Blastocatellia bacterium]|nr:beta-galactosidase [Blastocatellia bacterium]